MLRMSKLFICLLAQASLARRQIKSSFDEIEKSFCRPACTIIELIFDGLKEAGSANDSISN